MSLTKLFSISLLAFFSTASIHAQEILTEEAPLDGVSQVVIIPHKSHHQGMKLEEKDLVEWKTDVDPERVEWNENTRILVAVREAQKGTFNYYLALADDTPKTKLGNYKDRPLYYDAEDFKIEARLLVDSASMELSFYRDMYLKGFRNYLRYSERFEAEPLANFWSNQFYLLPEDTMYFMSDQLDRSSTKTTLPKIFPNSLIIERDQKTIEKPKENATVTKTKKKSDSNGFESKEDVIAAKGLPIGFIKSENAIMVQVIPFIKDGERYIQKYFLTKNEGIVHGSVRQLKPVDQPLYSSYDLRPFKEKPSPDELNGLKNGKGRR